MIPTSPLRNFLLAAGSSLIAVSSASAQTNYFWDLNGATTGTGGTGTWNATDNFWRTVSDTGVLGTWNSGDTSIAIFGGTPGTVTLGTGITAGGLTFTTGGYTITGNTLTLAGTSAPIINATTGITTISSIIAGTNGLQKNGGGSLVLSNASNSFSGGITLNGGTLSFGANGHLGAASNAISVIGSGTSTLTSTAAGAQTYNRAIDIASTATLNIGFTTSESGYSGALTGSGTLTNGAGSQPYVFSSTSNTFTGTVNAVYGMRFASLGDGGTYNFGSSSVGLAWTGGARTFSTRSFNVNAAGNAPITNNGSGALVIETNLAVSGAAGARTLILSGTYTGGTNRFAGNISDVLGSSPLAVTKTGDNSIWALSGTNSYTGATTLGAGGAGNETGLMIFQGLQALSASTSLNQSQGGGNVRWGTIRLLDDSATPASRSGVNLNWTILENINPSTEPNRYFMRVFVGNNSTANLGTSSSTQTGSTIQLGNLNLSEGTTTTPTGQGLWVSGANGYRLQLANVNVSLNASTTGNHVATLRADNPMTVTGTVRQANDAGVGSNTTLALEGSATSSLISGAIRNSAGGRLMNVTKAGSGTWALSGTNDYTGTTSVSNGRLNITGNSSAATGNVAISGGALGGNGSLGGAVTVSSTGGIDLRDSAIGTLTLGSSLNITGALGANNLRFDLGNGTGTSDSLSVAGTTTVTTTGSAVIDMNWLGGASGRTVGTYNLIGGAGTLDSTNAAKFSLPITKAFGQTYTLSHNVANNGDLDLVVANVTSVTPAAFWAGGGNNWSTTGNWRDTLAGGGTVAGAPDYQTNVTFSTTTPTPANLTTNVLDTDFNINSLNFTDASGNVTIAGPGALTLEAAAVNGNTAGNGINSLKTSGTNTISARVALASSQTWTVASGGTLAVSGVISDFGLARTLTKAGAGTLTLSGANTYTGGTTISSGTLSFANGSLGTTGNITVDGGRLQWASGNTQDISARLTLQNSGNATLDTNSNNVTLATAFGGSTSSSLTKIGAGTLTLSGANTYTGGTTVSSGTLSFANGSLGTTGSVTVNGGTLQWGTGNTQDISARLTLQNSGSATLDTNSNIVTLATGFGGSTTSSLTKSGAGTLTLSGSNSYTGATTLNAGALTLANVNAIQNSSGLSIATTGLTLNLRSDTAATFATPVTTWTSVGNSSTTINVDRFSSGTGNQLILSSGFSTTQNHGNGATVNISGNNGYTLSIPTYTINRGSGGGGGAGHTINATTTVALGSINVATNAGGILLTLGGSAAGNTVGGISGVSSPNVIKTGSSTWAITSSGNYGGTTTIQAGSLIAGANAPATTGAGSNGAFGNAASALVLGNGSTAAGDAPALLISGAFTVARPITVGSLANTAAYNATIGGSNTTGLSTFSGNITLNTAATTYTTTLRAATGGTTQFSTGTWTTNNKAIAIGSSGNTGTVRINNNISTSGGITVNFGTLELNSAFTGGNMAVASGTTLSGNGSVAGTTGVTSGTVNGSGLVLTGATTFNGTGNTLSGTVSTNASLASAAALALSGALTGTLDIGNGTLTGIGGSVSSAASLNGGIVNLTSGTLSSTLGVTGGFWNGNGSVTGRITSSSGIFTIGNGANLTADGNLDVTGGTLAAGNSSSTITGSVHYTSSSNSTFAGIIAGSGKTLTMNSPNTTLTLTGTNTYTGATTINNGILELSGSGSINGSDVTVNGGSFINNSSVAYTGTLTLNNASLGGGTIDGDITYSGGGTVSGSTSVTGSVGSSSGSFSVESGANLTVGTGLNVSGTAELILASTASVTGSINYSSSVNSTIEGVIAGSSQTLTKSGNSTLTLSGANTYTGATNVNAGKLLIHGSTSADSAFTVNNGATLGGRGTIGGSVTLMSGATLSPGASIESLGLGSSAWNGGSTLQVEFSTDGSTGAAGTDWDLVNITGTLDLSGASSGTPIILDLVSMLNATDAGALAVWDGNINATWAGFVTTTGGITGFAANKFAFNTTNFQNTLNGTFNVSQHGNNLNLNYVTNYAIPEPKAALLGGIGLLLLLRRRR